jgi:fermentation-respiration switch protein FrsA (DUF1100 family)
MMGLGHKSLVRTSSMGRFHILAAAVVLVICVSATLWWARERRHIVDERERHETQIAALETELAAARQLAAEQRELLREQTLRSTRRAPDEFFSLLPAKFPQGDWRPADTRFEDCWFRSADGLRLHGWLLVHPQPRCTVLVVHGNAGNLTHRAPLAVWLRDRCAASVLLFDYRGYGRSEGVPTITGLMDDARGARRLLAERAGTREQAIVLWGESLGGAIAVDLAARDGARGLVLVSTFASYREVGALHFPKLLVDALVADRLDSAATIGQYQGPLLQLHGTADRTIPLAHGQRLFAAANDPKTFVELPGSDHNDPLPEFALAKIAAHLESLPPTERQE